MVKYKVAALEWSNLFLLVPLVAAVIHGLYWYALILFALSLISFDYHFFKEAKEVYFLDVVFSWVLMLSNLALVSISGWALPYSAIAVILALIALSFYFLRSKRNYYLYHSLWHIFSAGVCLFCLLAYFT